MAQKKTVHLIPSKFVRLEASDGFKVSARSDRAAQDALLDHHAWLRNKLER